MWFKRGLIQVWDGEPFPDVATAPPWSQCGIQSSGKRNHYRRGEPMCETCRDVEAYARRASRARRKASV